MSLSSIAMSSAGFATGLFANASVLITTGPIAAFVSEKLGGEPFSAGVTTAIASASLLAGAAGTLTISPFTAGLQIATRIAALAFAAFMGTVAGILQTEERHVSDSAVVFGGVTGLITGVFSAVIATTYLTPPMAEASIGALVSGLTSYTTAVLIG